MQHAGKNLSHINENNKSFCPVIRQQIFRLPLDGGNAIFVVTIGPLLDNSRGSSFTAGMSNFEE
jgi:hypothetical protein